MVTSLLVLALLIQDDELASHGLKPGYRPNTCGPVALLVVCRWYQIETSLTELEQLCRTTATGTTVEGLIKGASAKGLVAEARRANLAFLMKQTSPVIIDCPQRHFCVLIGWRAGQALIYDPPSPARWVSAAELQANWAGHVILITRRP